MYNESNRGQILKQFMQQKNATSKHIDTILKQHREKKSVFLFTYHKKQNGTGNKNLDGNIENLSCR